MSKKLIVKALFDVNRVPELSKLSEALNLNIGSDIAAKADIDKNWKTTAESSLYGTLYIKPTINVYDVMTSKGITMMGGKIYYLSIASDIAVIGDNEDVGAVYVDSRVPSTAIIIIENNGLLLGRGGRPAFAMEKMVGLNVPYERGYDGGSAVKSNAAKVYVINKGGVASGGGGGGTTGATYQQSIYTTGQTAMGSAFSGFMTPGGGAPFGLRASASDGIEHLMYLNRSTLGSMEDVANPYARNSNGINGVGASRFVWAHINYDTSKVTGIYDDNRNKVITLDKAITLMPTMIKVKTAGNASGYHIGQIFNDPRYAYAAKLRSNPYDESTPTYFTTNGATVRAASWAGLFKGGLGSEYRSVIGDVMNVSMGILLKSQPTVDLYKDTYTGAKGGDLGKVGAKGNIPKDLTMTYTLNSDNSESKISITNNLSYGSTVTKTIPTPGGNAGPLFSGDVVISNVEGGVTGGVDVIAKYDPNGNYDELARGIDYTKTFLPIYY